jgi:hypothetical protein
VPASGQFVIPPNVIASSAVRTRHCLAYSIHQHSPSPNSRPTPNLTFGVKNCPLQWCNPPIDFDQSTEYNTVTLTLVWRGCYSRALSASLQVGSVARGLPSSVLDDHILSSSSILNIFSPAMSSSFAPSVSPLHPTERISQGVISDISQRLSQRLRYASFSYAHQLASKYDPRVTVHLPHRSTSSTMIPYFTYFISIDRLLP